MKDYLLNSVLKKVKSRRVITLGPVHEISRLIKPILDRINRLEEQGSDGGRDIAAVWDARPEDFLPPEPDSRGVMAKLQTILESYFGLAQALNLFIEKDLYPIDEKPQLQGQLARLLINLINQTSLRETSISSLASAIFPLELEEIPLTDLYESHPNGRITISGRLPEQYGGNLQSQLDFWRPVRERIEQALRKKGVL